MAEPSKTGDGERAMPDRVCALALNELTAALKDVDRFVALTERLEIARRVVAVVREEIRRESAESLRRAAAGRREYAERMPDSYAGDEEINPALAATRDKLVNEAVTYEAAASVVEDPRHLLGLIPSWRWTDEEAASLRQEATDG